MKVFPPPLLLLQILIIGKSINFLRQVCHDHTPLWSPSLRLWFTTESGQSSLPSSFMYYRLPSLSPFLYVLHLPLSLSSGEVTFASMTGPSLQSVVAQTYRETSRHLLQIMNTKYSFGKHLQVHTYIMYFPHIFIIVRTLCLRFFLLSSSFVLFYKGY